MIYLTSLVLSSMMDMLWLKLIIYFILNVNPHVISPPSMTYLLFPLKSLTSIFAAFILYFYFYFSWFTSTFLGYSFFGYSFLDSSFLTSLNVLGSSTFIYLNLDNLSSSSAILSLSFLSTITSTSLKNLEPGPSFLLVSHTLQNWSSLQNMH